jgi:hypothetical protein
MTKRIRTTVGTLAALSALALGGSAIAGAANQPSKAPAPAKAAAPATAPGDNVQDTTSPDAPGTPSESSGETPAGSEAGGSETPNNDGPGGHADEPGNPNADNQFQGVQ